MLNEKLKEAELAAWRGRGHSEGHRRAGSKRGCGDAHLEGTRAGEAQRDPERSIASPRERKRRATRCLFSSWARWSSTERSFLCEQRIAQQLFLIVEFKRRLNRCI